MATMTAYYNENDPYAAAWLRNLIKENLVAPGDVDERSIVDLRPADLAGYTQCHFFAGIGGWSLALRLAGWPDDRPVWTGSCPCQPFSVAGKQRGFDDERHLWPVWRELIRECAPPVVFGEQVASATQWLGLVRSDLEAMGYAVGAMPIQAASAGADHLRDRFWFVGHDTRVGWGEGWPEHEVRRRRSTPASDGGIFLADSASERRPGPWPLGEPLHSASSADGEADQSLNAGPGTARVMADADSTGTSEERQQRSGQFVRAGGDQQARDVGDSAGIAKRKPHDQSNAIADRGEARSISSGPGDYEFVISADGKARRIKPGVRLLVDGFPSRVGLLRGFGNAIDPRPATEFIKAASGALIDPL